jgi:hypothetical protein
MAESESSLSRRAAQDFWVGVGYTRKGGLDGFSRVFKGLAE